MDKAVVFAQEAEKLTKLFQEVELAKAQLVEGLIQDAAFLYAENEALRKLISKTGMVKIHPSSPDIQKPTEAGKQYVKNTNSYAVIIKTLNGILSKNGVEQEDAFDQFLRQSTDHVSSR